MLDRILKIMDYNKFTPSEFADVLEIDRSRLSHILNGRNNPSLEIVMKILEKFPEISSDWLLFGSGNMLKNIETSNKNSNLINEKNKPTTAELDLEIPESYNDDKNIDPQNNVAKDIKEEIDKLTTTPASDNSAKEINYNAAQENTAATRPTQLDNKIFKEIISITWFFSDGTFKSFTPEK
ncbi:MAG: helix-turn-helix transcriptional regulator [Bacteroidales bacterium]|nr:helix-turn-helix transcriptional regulator [Bacteroidales bacterium]